MSRYIDADRLRKDILGLPNCYNGFSDTYDKALIIDRIDAQPTADVVEADKAQKEIDYWHDKAQSYEQTILKLSLNKAEDAVEVVRCKDCIHNHITSWNQGKRDKPSCRFSDLIRSNEFYCGFGERAEE